jgi:hypothetical protein
MPNLEQDGSEERYRERRRNYLTNYSFILASQHRDLEEVIGIATEPQGVKQRSHDLHIYRPAPWTAQSIREARQLQERMNVLFKHNLKRREFHADEFPAGKPNRSPPATTTKKRTGRNELCPCGSNAKFKKCCGMA